MVWNLLSKLPQASDIANSLDVDVGAVILWLQYYSWNTWNIMTTHSASQIYDLFEK